MDAALDQGRIADDRWYARQVPQGNQRIFCLQMRGQLGRPPPSFPGDDPKSIRLSDPLDDDRLEDPLGEDVQCQLTQGHFAEVLAELVRIGIYYVNWNPLRLVEVEDTPMGLLLEDSYRAVAEGSGRRDTGEVEPAMFCHSLFSPRLITSAAS